MAKIRHTAEEPICFSTLKRVLIEKNKSVDICITSGAKGGTGKTTFANVFAYTYHILTGTSTRVVKPLDSYQGIEIAIVDFPAFQLTDKKYLKRLLRCDAVLYIVEEDFETLRAIEILHMLIKAEVLGVVINKVLEKPSKEFISIYSRFGKVYIIHFDKKLAIHKSVGIPPYRLRSIATLEIAKAAVDIIRKIEV
ncbi:conserved hypothetical protein [Pyrobaculum islandicum DSM 4184]|uniref:CobQ/CobB/MinD/ParA nucleotide binding domain-containing protein n=1 Tax=Pyrobaculum islandicum (strain DSM 4184 / JCM 9189 / GEO3) TaxID=384616 RepID=A1RT95_PYRIL|nr:hypothetical protein [Pyrobaculum islandicum]ABL88177.1 conserved hypothetical protein [Pyrobaculum islandicum DSM 4184]